MYYSTNRGAGRAGKPVIARSTFMHAEEIERERQMSGYNPYEGEEEPDGAENGRETAAAGRQMSGYNPYEGEEEPDGAENGRETAAAGRQMSGYNPYEGEEEPDGAENGRETAAAGRQMSGYNPYEGEEELDGAENGRASAIQMEPYIQAPDQAQILQEQQDSERDLRRLQSMYPEAAKLMLPYVEDECDRMEYSGSPMFDQYPDQTTVYRLCERICEQVKDQLPQEPPEEPDVALSMQYQERRAGRPGKNWVSDLARVLLLQEMHHRRCRRNGCRKRRGF